jgi:hypothetical protein
MGYAAFGQYVANGLLPGHVTQNGKTKLYDLRAIDAALDGWSGLAAGRDARDGEAAALAAVAGIGQRLKASDQIR